MIRAILAYGLLAWSIAAYALNAPKEKDLIGTDFDKSFPDNKEVISAGDFSAYPGYKFREVKMGDTRQFKRWLFC